MSKPVVLLLAAGASTRFGTDKRLHRFRDGRRLIDRMLDIVAEAQLPVCVVLRPDDDLKTRLPVTVCEAPHAKSGMGNSIADAVGQLPPEAPGCLILPVDLPLLMPETLVAVTNHLQAGSIVQPVYQGRAGHPVGFSAVFFPELVKLTGDEGGKSILQRHSSKVVRLTVTDAGIYQDMDTPDRLQELDL